MLKTILIVVAIILGSLLFGGIAFTLIGYLFSGLSHICDWIASGLKWLGGVCDWIGFDGLLGL